MDKIRRHIQNNRGQSMVEFALVLPLLLLLVFGMIEFGRVFNESLVVTAAAREGARSAAVGGSDTVATNAALNYIVPSDRATAIVAISPSVRVGGQSVTVTVTNQVRIFTPLIGAFFPSNPVIVSGSAVMRVE
jgi:Flp pilus assembly protein TadG